MALPAGVEARTREEWTRLAKSMEPKDKMPLMTALKKCGFAATDYMGWSAEKRVDEIMKVQDSGGEEPKGKASAATETAPAPSGTSKSKASDSTGSAVSSKEISALREEVAALSAQVKANAKVLDEIRFILACVLKTNPEAEMYVQEADVQAAMLGKSTLVGNG